MTSQENHHVSFLERSLLSAALMAPIAMAPTALRAEDQKPLARITTNNTMTTMHGTAKKLRRTVSMQSKTTAPTASFPSSRRRSQNYWNWRHEHSDSLLKIEIKIATGASVLWETPGRSWGVAADRLVRRNRSRRNLKHMSRRRG